MQFLAFRAHQRIDYAVGTNVKKDELTLEDIRQFYVAIGQEEWKLDTLCDLYGNRFGRKRVAINFEKYCHTLMMWLSRHLPHYNIVQFHAAY